MHMLLATPQEIGAVTESTHAEKRAFARASRVWSEEHKTMLRNGWLEGLEWEEEDDEWEHQVELNGGTNDQGGVLKALGLSLTSLIRDVLTGPWGPIVVALGVLFAILNRS